MATCRTCAASIKPFMSFGRMPIANGFLRPEQFKQEYFFELATAFCEACGTFQIVEQPDPEKMFHENYAFFTRTSAHMVTHFREYAEWVKAHYLSDVDPFVVEIGSNDGALLENFANAGIRHLGVEPSANVAAEARRHGVESLVSFFDAGAGERIRDQYGEADAILAANVMCHIPDLHGVAKGAELLLKPKGILVFEDPYLGAMIEKTSYDQIYDEHVFIFSLKSVQSIFGPYGFEVIDVLPQATHGGSMRYVLARRGARPVSPAVSQLASGEDAQGLGRAATYQDFRTRCEHSRDQLLDLLNRLKAEGKRVVGYGATSKSTTVMNYCGIGPQHIEFISDTTPIKQGKYTPGSHIPVKPYDEFKTHHPDYALLFAWNHKAEIMSKEAGFRSGGGKWIVFVPEVSIIEG
ncbi:class I SAM-dependent methyltransferase [Ferrovibrio sp.]|uniref:class I SAM-dependent methyltransferase n=1 Tax=Ferrovibrio sp. TaxID=1917215 RepID=UPI000CC2795A|nr:class I SAM-dependent methyltransferase [Ferrovibrio sp.]PJI41911.1 MAG: SAM-dependent methyltransferase [Ferrovibrio sp.]